MGKETLKARCRGLGQGQPQGWVVVSEPVGPEFQPQLAFSSWGTPGRPIPSSEPQFSERQNWQCPTLFPPLPTMFTKARALPGGLEEGGTAILVWDAPVGVGESNEGPLGPVLPWLTRLRAWAWEL